MQILLLSLIIGIFIHDAQAQLYGDELATPQGWLVAALLLPKLVVAGVFHLCCIVTRRRMTGATAHRSVRRLERLALLTHLLLIVLYGADLYLGVLRWYRDTLGQLVFIDEFLVMLPTLAVIVWTWWAYYPIDRRLREASTINRLDHGMPVYPIWSRRQYIVAQLRHQFALILLPLAMLIAWAEYVELSAIVDRIGDVGFDPTFAVTLAGSAVIFITAPLIVRLLWDTQPLPDGPMRQRLVDLCEQHRVGVSELLLWKTFGGMINGAVMGLLPQLRYILLTDALLENVPQREVEAVMAHELAHVRKRHIIWLLVVAAALFALTYLFSIVAVVLIDHGDVRAILNADAFDETFYESPLLVAIAGVAGAAAWFASFGWISRRFERQADTFAVQHMTSSELSAPPTPKPKAEQSEAADHPPQDTPTPTITPDAANAMISALQHVAELNHIPVERKSWRHGSIRWRQDYLRTLVGQHPDRLPIDRHISAIKLTGAVLFAAFVALEIYLA